MSIEIFIWSLVVGVSIVGSAAIVAYRLAPVEILRGHIERHLSVTPRGCISSFGLAAPGTVQPQELPGHVVAALLLYEDDRFFIHRGINWPEVWVRIRAFIRGKDKLRGGSSISQQLVKNVVAPAPFRYPILRWVEKAFELLCTIKLEHHFSKREILALYLSTARFGNIFPVGVKNAAQELFNRPSEQLTLAESFVLFGLLPSTHQRFIKIALWGHANEEVYRTAFVKCVDLYRLYALTWGWSVLESIESISTRDVIERMQEYATYNPRQLPPELEIALEMRASEQVKKIRELHRLISEAHSPESIAERSRSTFE